MGDLFGQMHEMYHEELLVRENMENTENKLEEMNEKLAEYYAGDEYEREKTLFDFWEQENLGRICPDPPPPNLSF